MGLWLSRMEGLFSRREDPEARGLDRLLQLLHRTPRSFCRYLPERESSIRKKPGSDFGRTPSVDETGHLTPGMRKLVKAAWMVREELKVESRVEETDESQSRRDTRGCRVGWGTRLKDWGVGTR